MNKTYIVRLPITGVVDLEVEASSEEDAIDKALQAEFDINSISEWEACKHIVQGNVFYGHTNKAKATEV